MILLTIATILLLAAGILAYHHFFGPKREHEFERRKQLKTTPNRNQRYYNERLLKQPVTSITPPLSACTMPAFNVEDHSPYNYYSSSTVKVRSPANPSARVVDIDKIFNDAMKQVNTNMDRQMKTLDQMLATLDKNLDRVSSKTNKYKTNSTGGR